MRWMGMAKLWVVVLSLSSWTVAATALAQGVQFPPAVRQQASEIQDRFAAVLDEECPAGSCYSLGCKPSRFETLDQTADSSLPGLETSGTMVAAQYRLTSVLCELAYEPTLKNDELTNLRQRIRQKVKTVGVDVQLSTKPLQPKADAAAQAAQAKDTQHQVPPTWQEGLWNRLLPFLPWFVLAILLAAITLLLVWGIRRLGTGQSRRASQARTRATDLMTQVRTGEAEPTPHMLLTRVEQIRGELKANKRLVELTLKKHFDEEHYPELCSFLQYFGPELLVPFKEKAEYRTALGTLSEKYAANEGNDDPHAMWKFLGSLERDMTAAKVRIDAEPLADDFNFLMGLEVDEFVGVLRDLTEEEAIAAVAYAPRALRERFFTSANPAFTAKFVEHLTSVDKMSDSFVRGVAQKLRRIYTDKGDSLRTIRVDRIPLLEAALNALEPAKRRQLIANIGKDNPSFVHNMAPAVFLDDALPLLPVEVLTEALLLITPEEAGQYLAGFSWSGDVLAKINPRLAEAIKKQMPLVPLDGSKGARIAHEKFSAYIKRLHADGTIDLRKINSSLVEPMS